jgi:hypothetical protein
VVVTSLVSEQFEVPSSRCGGRRLHLARGRVVEDLAGRTVWGASALPEGRVSAESPGRHLDWARGGGVEASWIEVPALEPLLSLARRLEAMLRGSARPTTKPGRADREAYSQGCRAAGRPCSGWPR